LRTDGGIADAAPTVLHVAAHGTAVIEAHVAVVTLLAGIDDAVAAALRAQRRLLAAGPSNLSSTRGRAAIAVPGVAVIAFLTRIEPPVAAETGTDGGAARRALPSRFEETRGCAPVTGIGVPVVTLLSATGEKAIAAIEHRAAK